ncbi:unnamed protein product [Hyaloperonospora brassicae]|uniref:Reverse transcriptase Ty1/copia-type domain-containing protein n=1 Tax=Hyaloperonospora brassicae TaxID=162125 RepID=A0AAV0TQG1_HYABA|nr:unnamed protein product [Hyaloperonospora brassicae]
MSTVKVIRALAATWNVPAKHGDIPKAYVRQLGSKDKNGVVLQIKKSLYGLKKAGRLWSQLLHSSLTDAGFLRAYVDDLLVAGTSTSVVDRFFVSLSTLANKDLGEVSKFLGIRVTRDGSSYALDQE